MRDRRARAAGHREKAGPRTAAPALISSQRLEFILSEESFFYEQPRPEGAESGGR